METVCLLGNNYWRGSNREFARVNFDLTCGAIPKSSFPARVYRTQSELGRVPAHHEEGGVAQKRDPILVFSVHATLTKTLPNNTKSDARCRKRGKHEGCEIAIRVALERLREGARTAGIEPATIGLEDR